MMIFLSTVLLCLVLVYGSDPSNAPLATLKLTSSQTSRLQAEVSLTNGFNLPQHILSWNTPFDPLFGGLSFVVLRNGVHLQYEGIVARRVMFADYDQFVTISPQETRTAVFDLSEVYDISEEGSYEVFLDTTVQYYAFSAIPNMIAVDMDLEDLYLTSNVAQIKVEGFTPRRNFSGEGQTLAPPTYRNCQATEQTRVLTAWNNFGTLSLRMVNALPNSQTSTVYRTWMGVYTAARFNTVSRIVNNLRRDSQTGQHLFDCRGSSCSSGVIAYVYPGQPATVYLCTTFFNLPATGPTSQADTMVHEISHFTTIGGTQDYAYGQTNCRNLANSNADRAVLNADNYAFFSVFV